MAKRKWSWEMEVKRARERLADVRYQSNAEYGRDQFDKEIKKGAKADPIDLANYLTNIGGEALAGGTVKIADGDATGWSEILAGWTMNAWFEVVVLNNLYAGKFVSPAQFGFRDEMHAVALGIGLRRYNVARWLINHYRNIYDQKLSDWFSSYWLFMLHLCAAWQDQPPPEPRGKTGLGPFADVFKYWNQPAKLGPVIDNLCEAHVEATLKDVPPWDFDLLPYNFWAVELFALREVRSALGLETPAGTHPLAISPLNTAPKKITPTADPRLTKALPILEKAARYDKLDWQGKPQVRVPLPPPETIPNATPMVEKPARLAKAAQNKRKTPRGPAESVLQAVLVLCGVKKDEAAKFDPYESGDAPWDEALIAALADAPQALIVDWRGEWPEALEALAAIAARCKWKIKFAEADDRITVSTPQLGKHVWQRTEEDDFGALVKSLAAKADGSKVLSLKGMDGKASDTWSFVWLNDEKWEQVRAKLGDKFFKRIFVPLQASSKKWKPLK